MKQLRLLLGVAILGLGLFNFDGIITPKPPEPVVPVLVINTPSEALITITKPVADIVTGKEDRVSLAIFMYEASLRLDSVKYKDIKLQNFNDILVYAGKEYLESPVSATYPGFSGELQKMIVNIVGDDDIYLNEKAAELSDVFEALSWTLIQ